MILLLAHFWIWLVAALLVGLATGFLTNRSEPGGRISPWLSALIGGLAFGALAALLQFLPERAGVWLESALALCVAYLIGAALGSVFRGGSLREHKHWSLGLFPLMLTWVAGTIIAGAALETALFLAVGETLKRSGVEGASAVHGRDVVLARDAPNRPALIEDIKKIPGVRLVTEGFGPGADKAEDVAAKGADEKKGSEQAGQQDSGRAGEEAAKAVESEKREAPEQATPVAEKQATATAEILTDKATETRAKLAALPAEGELENSECETALNATVALEKIQFRSGRADVAPESEGLIRRLADILKRCPSARTEIAGHTDNRGKEAANLKLSQRRAEAVAKLLKRNGFTGDRVTAVGYGWERPVAPNDTEQGRAENRRIEFTLK